MKKFLVLVLVLFLFSSCSTKKNSSQINFTYEMQTKEVDMSKYAGLSSTEHMFKGVIVTEFFNCMDNKSSGVFYLGRENCSCCQTCLQYLNEVATNLNVTIYYLNVYDEEYPIANQETIDKLTTYLYDILAEVDGERKVQTPTVFSVINGEIVDSLICLGNYDWDDQPTKSQIKRLENKYLEILKPFARTSQD